MAREESGRANAAQIEYWNEVTGPKWAALGDLIDAQIGPLGCTAMDRAPVVPGERVIDVGCGCGHTSLELSRRVGAEGHVLGIDISAPMLGRAHELARGVENVSLLEADAQTHAFEAGGADLVFSRFGVMFFDDPTAAFANLRAALRPGGRLAFVCWQGLDRNPWLALPLATVAKHVELPTPPAPEAPGPFAFSDDGRVRSILSAAGWGDPRAESLNRKLSLGGTRDLSESAKFALQLGPAAAVLRDAEPEARASVANAILDALRPHWSEERGVELDAAAWIVTAERTA